MLFQKYYIVFKVGDRYLDSNFQNDVIAMIIQVQPIAIYIYAIR